MGRSLREGIITRAIIPGDVLAAHPSIAAYRRVSTVSPEGRCRTRPDAPELREARFQSVFLTENLAETDARERA